MKNFSLGYQTKMYFTCRGIKASASCGNFIDFKDLMTLPKRNLRARQRIITTLKISEWMSGNDKKTATVVLPYIQAN